MSITLVQALTTTASTTQTQSTAFASNNTAGNLLVAMCYYTSNGGSPAGSPTCSDSQGNTYSLIQNISTGAVYQCVSVYACYSCKAGANTVTMGATSGNTGNQPVMCIAEFSGGSGTWALDTGANGQTFNSTNATTWQSNTVTTSFANEVLVGCGVIASTCAITSPFASLGTNQQNYFLSWYEIVSSIQTGVSASGTCGSFRLSATLSGFYFAAAAAPTVTSCSPAAGPFTGGGETCTITGTNLTGATGVQFGANSATNVVVVNSTTITCTPPASTTGTGAVNVSVTTSGGTGTGTNVFTYAYIAYIGSASNNSGTTTLSLTYTPTVGNTVLIGVWSNAAITSVTDNNSHALTALASSVGADFSVFVGIAVSGATSYTVTTGSGNLLYSAVLVEYAGSNTAAIGPYTSATVSIPPSTTTLTVSQVTTENYSFIVAFFFAEMTTGGAGYGLQGTTGFLRNSAGYAIPSTNNFNIGGVLDNTAASMGTNVTDALFTTTAGGGSNAWTGNLNYYTVELITEYNPPLGTGELSMMGCGSK